MLVCVCMCAVRETLDVYKKFQNALDTLLGVASDQGLTDGSAKPIGLENTSSVREQLPRLQCLLLRTFIHH